MKKDTKRIEEIKRKIEALDNAEFFIYMADRWTANDKIQLANIEKERKKLKAELG